MYRRVQRSGFSINTKNTALFTSLGLIVCGNIFKQIYTYISTHYYRLTIHEYYIGYTEATDIKCSNIFESVTPDILLSCVVIVISFCVYDSSVELVMLIGWCDAFLD